MRREYRIRPDPRTRRHGRARAPRGRILAMLGLAQLLVVLDTTIVYDEGGAENGTTRARGSRSAPPAPGFGHRFDRHDRPALPGAAAVSPAFTAAGALRSGPAG
ncbi:hypothetical protein GCM10023257_11960 [Streptomyces hyderabadensis]|uniref:Uncharacterized protein n=1 Tax=Streptomyces hyderabadensis TaxID=598549 RepID=A0ABP9HQT8_9ACTN